MKDSGDRNKAPVFPPAPYSARSPRVCVDRPWAELVFPTMDLSDRAPSQLTHPPWPLGLRQHRACTRRLHLVGSQHHVFLAGLSHVLAAFPSAPNTIFLLFTYFYFVDQPALTWLS